jgi:hypothetical protein
MTRRMAKGDVREMRKGPAERQTTIASAAGVAEAGSVDAACDERTVVVAAVSDLVVRTGCDSGLRYDGSAWARRMRMTN